MAKLTVCLTRKELWHNGSALDVGICTQDLIKVAVSEFRLSMLMLILLNHVY